MARKLNKKAPERLASHPEDWDGRSVLGVHPKVVLADVRKEEWHIYENRLAARLVDRLSWFLSERIRQMKEVRSLLAGKERTLSGHYMLRHRIDTGHFQHLLETLALDQLTQSFTVLAFFHPPIPEGFDNFLDVIVRILNLDKRNQQ